MTRLLSTFFLMCFFLVAFAQPEVSLWRVHEGHQADLYECGEGYYFVHDGEQKVTHWSIKNEGNEQLELSLPLTFMDGSSDQIFIEVQPGQSSLAPGEETHFSLIYKGEIDGSSAYMPINSNASNSEECGLVISSGNGIDCGCRCSGSSVLPPLVTRQLKSNVESMTDGILECRFTVIDVNDGPFTGDGDGTFTFITDLVGERAPTMEGICFPSGTPVPNPPTCQPINITDPCNCDNRIELDDGTILFSDVLTFTGSLGQAIYFNSNNNLEGFVDENNVPITNDPMPTILPFNLDIPISNGLASATYSFYRQDGESVDVSFNGINFTSPPCSVAVCPIDTPIPTMGEWGLICLIVLFLIFGVVGFIQTTLAKA